MRVFQLLAYWLVEILIWATEEFKYGSQGNLAIFKLPVAILILFVAFTPLIIFALLLKLFDESRRLIRGY